MKLRNLARGQRVSILERRAVASNGKIRNCYELVIRVGKGKDRAVILRSRVEKAIAPLFTGSALAAIRTRALQAFNAECDKRDAK